MQIQLQLQFSWCSSYMHIACGFMHFNGGSGLGPQSGTSAGGFERAAERPRLLPPAPDGPAGWKSGSYFHTWNTQLVYFLITNANDLDSISLPDEPVNRHEKFTRIFVAHGWRGG